MSKDDAVTALLTRLNELDCTMVEVCEPDPHNPSPNIIPIERRKLIAALNAAPAVDGEDAGLLEQRLGFLMRLKERTPDYEGDHGRALHYQRQRDALDAAIQALRQPFVPRPDATITAAAEPVAWMYERNGVAIYFQKRKPAYTTPAMGFTETPLYAHPAESLFPATEDARLSAMPDREALQRQIDADPDCEVEAGRSRATVDEATVERDQFAGAGNMIAAAIWKRALEEAAKVAEDNAAEKGATPKAIHRETDQRDRYRALGELNASQRIAYRIRALPLPDDLGRDETRDALKPFADAWAVATGSIPGLGVMSLAQLGALAGHEVSGVHFMKAHEALFGSRMPNPPLDGQPGKGE